MAPKFQAIGWPGEIARAIAGIHAVLANGGVAKGKRFLSEAGCRKALEVPGLGARPHSQIPDPQWAGVRRLGRRVCSESEHNLLGRLWRIARGHRYGCPHLDWVRDEQNVARLRDDMRALGLAMEVWKAQGSARTAWPRCASEMRRLQLGRFGIWERRGTLGVGFLLIGECSFGRWPCPDLETQHYAVRADLAGPGRCQQRAVLRRVDWAGGVPGWEADLRLYLSNSAHPFVRVAADDPLVIGGQGGSA